MQIMPRCKCYTIDKNLNKTCKNKKRCKLISDSSMCYSYKEKDEIYNSYKEK